MIELDSTKGFCTVAGDKVETLQQGAILAKDVIDSGSALRKLQELVEFSQTIS